MRSPWLIISLAIFALLGLLAACGGGDDAKTSATPAPSATAAATAKPVGVSDLAHAVVQIQAVKSGDLVWHGSGTLISKDGYILTNGHVVDDRSGEYDTLQIAITDRTDQAPVVKYIAEIKTVDYAIDLAVIKITKTIGGDDVTDQFPFVTVGDSDKVDIGQDVQILGYPGIGGETITFTRGSVSGFTSEHSVGDRAWIKTDATIAGGNSGGLAVDDAGQLIGVPSIAGSGSEGSAVDCRRLTDTNGDGYIDDSDTCVPVGGFINGLRPVNLAQNLIDDAENGKEYVSPYQQDNGAQATPVGGSFDTSLVDVSYITFAPDVTADDQPTETIVALPSNPQNVCAFWDYTGMQDGMSWDANWYVDGTLDEKGSIIGNTWSGGESGNWWVCVTDPSGLKDGTYEVQIQVEGEPQGASSLYVGDAHKVVSLDIVNEGTNEVCSLAISPTNAQNWGGDKLGKGITVPAGGEHTIKVGAGVYDILVLDCDDNIIVQDSDIEITDDGTYTITDSP
ncbi:MAG: serine protease [Chloroflexota bacterium]